MIFINEDIRIKELNSSLIMPGDVQSSPGEGVVYVNYGRVEDFERLTSPQYNINLTGRIAIMRYGKIYRGNKVMTTHREFILTCFQIVVIGS